jgi:hypothetical protein
MLTDGDAARRAQNFIGASTISLLPELTAERVPSLTAMHSRISLRAVFMV